MVVQKKYANVSTLILGTYSELSHLGIKSDQIIIKMTKLFERALFAKKSIVLFTFSIT